MNYSDSLLVDKVLKLHVRKARDRNKDGTIRPASTCGGNMRQHAPSIEKYQAQVSITTEGKDFTIKETACILRAYCLTCSTMLLNIVLKSCCRLIKTEDSVELSITDNGIGITRARRRSSKILPRSSGDTHNVKGYGLGLSYVAYGSPAWAAGHGKSAGHWQPVCGPLT
jgi:two-component system phosphate regulon sensor histidine kinase PhoR